MVDTLIIVALDVADEAHALALAQQLKPNLCRLKVGKQLFTAAGPHCVERLIQLGYDVFLDLKFHDIPTTVELACRAAGELGVWMVNVHALGGADMLVAARNGVGQQADRPVLLGVTLLTSMGVTDMQAIGLQGTPQQAVLRLAQLTQTCGLDGVVCSALEAPMLRAALGHPFCLVTPGIRPPGSSHDDQQRVVTPQAALSAGANYLVIGRPITHAVHPLQALLDVHRLIS